VTVVLRFKPGCPTERSAPELIRSVMDELGVSAQLRIAPIATDEEARVHRFLGSPTIRGNGMDIDPAARARTDFGLG